MSVLLCILMQNKAKSRVSSVARFRLVYMTKMTILLNLKGVLVVAMGGLEPPTPAL